MAEEKLSPNVKIGLIIGAVVIGSLILWVVVRKVKSLAKAFANAQDNRSEQQVLTISGMQESFNPSWYDTQANKLYNASNWTWYNPNCDENTTMSSLTALKNDMDYLALVSAFGVRDGYGMQGFIDGCLNQAEKDSVNSVFSGKGITKRI